MTSDARRQQLLDVTTRLVLERGFHDMSIEAVAREAGITRGIVYQHFGDLPTLLQAVVEREMERAHAQVSETTLSDLNEGESGELLLESLNAFLTAVRDHPGTWRLVLMPPEGAPESLRRSIERGRAMVRARMTAAVQALLDAKGESGDAELTANALSAVSDEYARLVLTDPSVYTPARVLQHARWWLHHAWT
jgi:AcrR family transcriptional regulator